jgi:hypothetical protein
MRKRFKSNFCQKLIVSSDEAPLIEEELLQPQLLRPNNNSNKVAVATIRGKSYYNIIRALKLMDLQFDSLSPQEVAKSNAKVIITTQDEVADITYDNRIGGNLKKGMVSLILDTELEKYPSIVKAKILRSLMAGGKYFDDQLTIGIDPGSRIGISAIYLHQEIVSIVESSPFDAVELVSAMLGGIESRKKIVKIGDGNIMMARQIAYMLKVRFNENVKVEIVDEHGTSLPQNTDTNRRGARDRSSARTIAFRTGKIFTIKQ